MRSSTFQLLQQEWQSGTDECGESVRIFVPKKRAGGFILRSVHVIPIPLSDWVTR